MNSAAMNLLLIALLESGHRITIYPPPGADTPDEYLFEIAYVRGDRTLSKHGNVNCVRYDVTYPASDWGRETKCLSTATAALEYLCILLDNYEVDVI